MKKALGAALVWIPLLLILTTCMGEPAQQDSSTTQPNIVFILTDDMRQDELAYMPKTKSLLQDHGITYNNAFVTTSECCPSRASILRGQYMHNHQVKANSKRMGGGWSTFVDKGEEDSTIATWLHLAGYSTMLAGKYLNQYASGHPEHVPPGWDEWYALSGAYDQYNYTLSENGKEVNYGSNSEDYLTDVLASKARSFIQERAGAGKPFFLYFAPYSPHDPFTPAPRHEGTFEGAQIPRNRSYNEQDISDKPDWVRNISPLSTSSQQGIDDVYKRRLEMLQSVDEAVQEIVNDLQEAGQLNNTYFVFSSDNGFLLGEHRLTSKYVAYEESIRVPLLIRGPDIPTGRITDQIALNIDFAPTFAELGGTSAPSFVDGRSLKPTFVTDASNWRTAFLEELAAGGGSHKVPPYNAVRTADAQKYIYYTETGAEEYYDLTQDPYELDSAPSSSVVSDLKGRLAALKDCVQQVCRDAEDGTTTGNPANLIPESTTETTSKKPRQQRNGIDSED